MTDIEKLVALNESCKKIGAMSFILPDGYPCGEPMTVLYSPTLGKLVLAAKHSSIKVTSVKTHNKFTVKVGQPFGENALVKATANVLPHGSSPDVFKEVWCPNIEKYFDGLEDPELCLIVVNIDEVVWNTKK